MTDAQINRHEMHQAVLLALDAHAEAYAAAPAVAAHRDALAALAARVRTAAQAQARSTRGATATKAGLRDAVADRSWRLAQALGAWARDDDRPDVAGAVGLTRREFNALRDLELAEYSEVVVAEARPHLPADGDDPATGLGAYGVTAAFVDALDALDDQFAENLATPRDAIAARKGARARIAAAQSEAAALLNDRLDPAVDFLAPDHPDFAQAYRDARLIVDRGVGRGSDTPPVDGDDVSTP